MNDEPEIVESDEEGNEPSSNDKIKKLREKLKICEKERQEYLDGWQRAQADFVNTRREEEKARNEFVKFAREDFFSQILPVLDSFEMAFANKEVWEKVDENWRKGVEYIYSQLQTVLTQNGFSVVAPAEGDVFDPIFHAAVETVFVTSNEMDGKIVSIVQKGYSLNGKLVRPAKVKVGESKKN